MNKQIGTIKEIGARPGDVVKVVAEIDHDIIGLTAIVEETSAGHICTRLGNRSLCADYDTSFGRKFRIVSRATPSIDLTAITTPFGLLDKATQDALIAHGGPYQWFSNNGWRDDCAADLTKWKGIVHRVKPAPKRETVTKTAWVANDGSVDLRGPDNCTITYDLVDGEIDMETYKVTKK